MAKNTADALGVTIVFDDLTENTKYPYYCTVTSLNPEPNFAKFTLAVKESSIITDKTAPVSSNATTLFGSIFAMAVMLFSAFFY